MKIVAMIPARMGSSRFPGKPLAPILGRPMIEHVYRRTALGPSISEVYLATCDDQIREAAEAFGAKVIMTSDRHQRASDRCAEAAQGIEADIVVMVQGDEPMTVPEMIEESLVPFREDAGVQCTNLAKRIASEDEFLNPGTIKVVMSEGGDALYMSRQPIPTPPAGGFRAGDAFKQVCVIPFRQGALARYSALQPTPLEIAESVDMMRFIEHGHPVRMVETEYDTQAVDTPAELALVEEMMRVDPLVNTY